MPVRQPRVNDKRIDEVTGERKRFASAILPAWSRKSPRVAEVLPLLYLHGLSSSDFGPALEQFLGSDAGLSAATITRLTTQWQDEARAFNGRSLAGIDYVYVWVDGIHLKVRLEAGQGVSAGDHRGPRRRPQGAGRARRRVPGVRRSRGRTCCATASAAAWPPRCWRSATARSASGRRSVTCSPRPGSSGAGGTRSATCSPRCRSRRSRPRSGRWRRSTTPRTRPTPQTAAKVFAAEFGVKWPKAAAKITDDLDVLLGVLRLPGRALDPPADHEPDRVDLRHGPAAARGSPRDPAPGPPGSRWRSS